MLPDSCRHGGSMTYPPICGPWIGAFAARLWREGKTLSVTGSDTKALGCSGNVSVSAPAEYESPLRSDRRID